MAKALESASSLVKSVISRAREAGGGGGGASSSTVSQDDVDDLYAPLRWDGWGYEDTAFTINDDGQVELLGSRYGHVFEKGRIFPSFRSWSERVTGVSFDKMLEQRSEPAKPEPPILSGKFMEFLRSEKVEHSTEDKARVFHGHGHTCQEVYRLRFSKLPRVPDVVVYPASHDDVVAIMNKAIACGVCLIPFGGGTSVSGGLECPEGEKRSIVSVDMKHMNRIKYVDKENMMACVEAGARGKEIEQRLMPMGVTMGHEPDSYEFSTMGGWVATRASGMKKNVYGNIEDIVVNVKMVTPSGVVERVSLVPRASIGPDLSQLILGSEGILGIVTEVVIRIRPIAECKVFGSIVFPDFVSGVQTMREVAARRVFPASIRLVDNMQFQFGQSLKPEPKNALKSHIMDTAKKMMITKLMGFEVDKMVAATLLFEGSKEEVEAQQKVVYEIGKKYGGIKGGGQNGIRGYFLTYMIAYLRDYAMRYGFIAESFETSVPWSNVLSLCHDVKARIHRECKAVGVQKKPFVSCRVTQAYDTGAAVYFYFGFSWIGLSDPEDAFTKVETAAREEILAHGGSLSHHHGIGKHRKKFLPRVISPASLTMLKAIKTVVDPKDVMASRNLFDLD